MTVPYLSQLKGIPGVKAEDMIILDKLEKVEQDLNWIRCQFMVRIDNPKLRQLVFERLMK